MSAIVLAKVEASGVSNDGRSRGNVGSADNAGNVGNVGPKGLGNLAQEPVGLGSRFRPEGPWKPSPGFSLGGVTINATSPEGAEEIVI
jgi:hypothetical protein